MSSEAKGKRRSPLKSFRHKHPRFFPFLFAGLFAAGLLAGIIAFAVLLGQDPGNELNQRSLIGFVDFALIVAVCVILWRAFGVRTKATASASHAAPTPSPTAVK